MKFRISLAGNILLLIVTIILGRQLLSVGIGDYYYRKMVGVVAAGAASELDKGHAELVRQTLGSIPSDPDYTAIIEAGKKVGVIK